MTRHDEGIANLLKHSDFQAYNDFLNELRERDKELLAVKIVEKKPDLVIDNSGNSDNMDLKVVN